MPAHHRLKAHLVVRVRVGDVELPVRRPDGHAEEHSPDPAHDADLGRWRGVGVEQEHVVVGEREGDRRAPVAPDLVLPAARGRVELHDQAGVRSPRGRPGRRRWQTAVGGHDLLGDRGRLVAGVEDGRVDDRAVGTGRERPRGVAEELHERERRTARVVRVEDPHVGASHAGRGELRATRGIGGEAVLAAARAGDERPAVSAPGEHDVPRLVAHEQRPRDPRERRVGGVDLDDAHAVGEVVHDPHLGRTGEVGARGEGHRLEADGDLGGQRQAAGADRVDRQAVVRRVDGEEPVARRRERERPNLPALEVDERPGAGGGSGHEKTQDGDNAPDHVLFLPNECAPSRNSAGQRCQSRQCEGASHGKGGS